MPDDFISPWLKLHTEPCIANQVDTETTNFVKKTAPTWNAQCASAWRWVIHGNPQGEAKLPWQADKSSLATIAKISPSYAHLPRYFVQLCKTIVSRSSCTVGTPVSILSVMLTEAVEKIVKTLLRTFYLLGDLRSSGECALMNLKILFFPIPPRRSR